MEPNKKVEVRGSGESLNRRALMTGAVATGVAAMSYAGVAGQSPPHGTPEAASELDEERVMAVSTNLCGGATLKAENVGALLTILNSDDENVSAFEELEAIADFTDEAMSEVSPEGQALAANILQYWYLGRFNDAPVEERSEMFFDLACWQTLPYATQPSTCKSFGYWAVEIEL